MPTSRLSSPTSSVRRGAAALAAPLVLAAGLLITSVALAGPAAAVPAEGWPVADDVDALYVILVLVGIPLLLCVVITLLVYVPALARGERVSPGAPSLEEQWLGGPRKSAGELAAPDTDASQAGGASGRW